MPRSVARADVAELSGALASAVKKEGDHHLVIVSTNKVLSTTQFKQMFYSRGDDFFQVANCYECPDSADSILNSVWGVVDEDSSSLQLRSSALGKGEVCMNFNKLGGRPNDPSGVAWAYSYAADRSRDMYAQHEVMGYLEKDTCVKRDFWSACSRMSIEDQLYGLAFASETDQDLCMKVTCARRWSEVEDALAESCLAGGRQLSAYAAAVPEVAAAPTVAQAWSGAAARDFKTPADAPFVSSKATTTGGNLTEANDSVTLDLTGVAAGVAVNLTFSDLLNTSKYTLKVQSTVDVAGADLVILGAGLDETIAAGGNLTEVSAAHGAAGADVVTDTVAREDLVVTMTVGNAAPLSAGTLKFTLMVEDQSTAFAPATAAGGAQDAKGHVDLYVNVRVSNGHPDALDTILRVRFTVAYKNFPSDRNNWNTRASTAAGGVIQAGVGGDAPEGGEDPQDGGKN